MCGEVRGCCGACGTQATDRLFWRAQHNFIPIAEHLNALYEVLVESWLGSLNSGSRLQG